VLHLLFDQRARVKPEDDERFIPGRSGAVLIDALSLGMIGELHPSLLKRHEILSPVVAIEIELRG